MTAVMRRLCLLLFCLAAACAKPTPVIIQLTPPPTLTVTSPPTVVVSTATIPATVFVPLEPLQFPTANPVRVATTPAAPGTPIPEHLSVITVSSAKQVRELARWGLGKINAYGYDPAGRWLAIGTTLGLYLYDAVSYTPVITLPTSAPVQALAFTPNSQHVLVALQNGSVVEWDTTTWATQTLWVSEVPEQLTVNAMAIAPFNRYLALAHSSNVNRFDLITVWDLALNRKIVQQAGQGPIVFLDHKTLMFAIAPQTFTRLDLESGTSRAWGLPPDTWENMALDAAGNLVAQTPAGLAYTVHGGGQPAYSWPLDVRFTPGPPLATTCVGSVAYHPTPLGLAFDTPHNRLAVLLLDGTLQLYAMDQAGAELSAEFPGFASPPVFAPDGNTFLALAKANGQLAVWRTTDGALVRQFSEYVAGFTAVSFSPDGALLAAAAPQAGAQVWRVADGQLLQTLGQDIVALSFMGVENFLATGDISGTISVWQADTGVRLNTFQAHTARINQLVFAGTGDYLFSTGADCTLRAWLWWAPERTPVAELVLGNAGTAVAFDTESMLVVANQGYAGPLQAWQFNSISNRFDDLNLTFPTNFHSPIFGQRPGFFLLQDVEDVALVRTAPEGLQIFPFSLAEMNERQVAHLQVAPTFRVLAGVSERDLQVLLWSLDEGQGLIALPGHTASITDLAFDPNNTLIATAATDGTVRLWGVLVIGD